jgi:hypothetical protein
MPNIEIDLFCLFAPSFAYWSKLLLMDQKNPKVLWHGRITGAFNNFNFLVWPLRQRLDSRSATRSVKVLSLPDCFSAIKDLKFGIKANCKTN